MDVKVFESGRGHLVNAKWGIWFYDRSWYELSDEELREVKSYKFTVAVVIAKPRNIVDLMMRDPISFIHTCALARYIVNYIDGMGSIDLNRLARDVRPDLLETAAARLERMRDRLLTLGTSVVSTEIAYGVPTEVILERARAAGPTLIVMGSQGRGLFREAGVYVYRLQAGYFVSSKKLLFLK